MGFLDKYKQVVEHTQSMKQTGTVEKVIGSVIESHGPVSQLNELCKIVIPNYYDDSPRIVKAEVVGFRDNNVLLMAYDDINGIAPGCEVIATGGPIEIPVGDFLLGRIISGSGEAIDGMGPLVSPDRYQIFNTAPSALDRPRINQILATGVRAIDGLLTIGRGQRIGIFSGSGVGKSTLLGMIARFTQAEVNVVALVGERGREVKEFIEKNLGREGMERTVMVVATGDRTPLVRLRAAYVATTIAEYFRDCGKEVLLMMDSVTRFARAQREIGLAVGEVPSQRGFPPSVYTVLPQIMERSGRTEKGSITGIYSVLIDADDMNEPIADAVRGILDGHVYLSRDMAMLNHYPAIDVLGSISRLMNDIINDEHKTAAAKIREVLASYKEAYELINIGAYARGSNPRVDYALTKIEQVNAFLRQGIDEKASFDEARDNLLRIFAEDTGFEENADIVQRKPVIQDAIGVNGMPLSFEEI